MPPLNKRRAYLRWSSKSFMRWLWVGIGWAIIAVGVIVAVTNWGNVVPSGYINGVPTGDYMDAGHVGVMLAFVGLGPIFIGLAIVPLGMRALAAGEKEYPVSDIVIPKVDLLGMARESINVPGSRIRVDINSDWIDVSINWQDSLAFAPLGVHMSQYVFKKLILVNDDYTYRELDFEAYADIDTRIWSFAFNKGYRCGRISCKKIEYSFGVDNDTGHVGLNKYSISTSDISNEIRKWLADRGYRRKD